MSDGHSKKTTDWLGRQKEEHFDADGNKTGETHFSTNWLGRAKQEHFDQGGAKIGETRRGSDWMGRDRAEHYDNAGSRTGVSRNDTDWAGRDVQRHYDQTGREAGRSRRETDWRGQTVKRHEGWHPKSPIIQRSQTTWSGSEGSSVSGRASGGWLRESVIDVLGGLGSVAAIIGALVGILAGSMWVTDHTNEFSLAWWLAVLAGLASAAVLLYVGFYVLMVFIAVWILYEIVKYFANHLF